MRSMTVFNYLFEATLWGSALILLLLAARALFRQKVGNRAVYVAWLLIALRLLLPISLPNPLMNELRPSLSVDVEARPITDQLRTRFIDACYDVSRALFDNQSSHSQTPLTELGAKTSYGQTGKWALLVWVSVAILIGLWMLLLNARFRRRIRRDRVRTPDVDEELMYHQLCVRYHTKPVPVYFVDRLPTSCLVGTLKPFIAVPLGTPREHLELTLAHELCHKKSLDGIWAFVRNLCCVVHWFNPLVWVAARLVRADCELACDDRVILPLNPHDRLIYSDTIVSAAEGERTRLSVLATGMTLTGKHLKKRINAILHNTRVKGRAIAIASVVGVVVLLVSFANSESYPLPVINDIPDVLWEASYTRIGTNEDAVAYTRRFLESEFIGYGTSGMQFTPASDEGVWRVYGVDDNHALPLILRFDEQGKVLEFDGTRIVGELPVGSLDYTHRAPTDSINEYLAAFGHALLPGEESFFAQTVMEDVRLADMRYLITRLLDDYGQLVHMEIVQVEPVTRMLYYVSGDWQATAEAVRNEHDVARATLMDLTEVDGFSMQCIDLGRFDCEWDEAARAWRLGYTVSQHLMTGRAAEVLSRLFGEAEEERLFRREWLVDASGNILERIPWAQVQGVLWNG